MSLSPPARSPSRLGLAVLVLASAACSRDDALTAPDAVAPPAAGSASAIAPDVLSALATALDDADARVTPAVAPTGRAPLHAALATLRAALAAGDAARGAGAAAALRALADRPAAADADAADLAAVALLADAAAQALATPGAPGRP